MAEHNAVHSDQTADQGTAMPGLATGLQLALQVMEVTYAKLHEGDSLATPMMIAGGKPDDPAVVS
jgi:hypothetical protein